MNSLMYRVVPNRGNQVDSELVQDSNTESELARGIRPLCPLSRLVDHNVISRRPCYSQVYVQPQLPIESHIRCEFTANQINVGGGLSRERVRA
jgi:hypothetical protein|eukprot:COSAG03_NODE_2619_length_2590_cov_1.409073_1_plen_93_part_00